MILISILYQLMNSQIFFKNMNRFVESIKYRHIFVSEKRPFENPWEYFDQININMQLHQFLIVNLSLQLNECVIKSLLYSNTPVWFKRILFSLSVKYFMYNTTIMNRLTFKHFHKSKGIRIVSNKFRKISNITQNFEFLRCH